MFRSISTHVLDVGMGRPAAGVRVRLEREGITVGVATTDADGRIANLSSANLEPGPHRLIFELDAYFGEREHLFKSVTLEIEGASGHQHLPLLISAFGATTYRGL